MEERIISLYFNEGKTLTKIAEILNIAISTVSRTLDKTPNYIIEKERRKEENLKERRKKQKQMIYANRKNSSTVDTDYQAMKAQLAQDTKLLSKTKKLNNMSLRKWCSAYSWNEKRKAFVFDKTIKKSNDLPDYIRI